MTVYFSNLSNKVSIKQRIDYYYTNYKEDTNKNPLLVITQNDKRHSLTAIIRRHNQQALVTSKNQIIE